MAKESLYFNGPWPLGDAAMKPLCLGGTEAYQKYHFSVSPDGTEFLCHGDFDAAVKSALPPGCVWLTHADAREKRVTWDKGLGI